MEIEPGTEMDRCPRCGGWISLGHALGSECREGLREEIKTRSRAGLEPAPWPKCGDAE
jgi:hypothetical protein